MVVSAESRRQSDATLVVDKRGGGRRAKRGRKTKTTPVDCAADERVTRVFQCVEQGPSGPRKRRDDLSDPACEKASREASDRKQSMRDDREMRRDRGVQRRRSDKSKRCRDQLPCYLMKRSTKQEIETTTKRHASRGPSLCQRRAGRRCHPSRMRVYTAEPPAHQRSSHIGPPLDGAL